MVENAPGEHDRFRRGDRQCKSGCAQTFEQLRHPVVEAVLAPAPFAEIFAHQADRLGDASVVEAVELAERLGQRRPDEGRQAAQVDHLDAEMAQGVLHRSCDPLHGVGQRTVEVEQQVGVGRFHPYVSRKVKGGRKIQAAVYNSAPRRFSEPLHTTDCRSICGKAAFADRPRPGGLRTKPSLEKRRCKTGYSRLDSNHPHEYSGIRHRRR